MYLFALLHLGERLDYHWMIKMTDERIWGILDDFLRHLFVWYFFFFLFLDCTLQPLRWWGGKT